MTPTLTPLALRSFQETPSRSTTSPAEGSPRDAVPPAGNPIGPVTIGAIVVVILLLAVHPVRRWRRSRRR